MLFDNYKKLIECNNVIDKSTFRLEALRLTTLLKK